MAKVFYKRPMADITRLKRRYCDMYIDPDCMLDRHIKSDFLACQFTRKQENVSQYLVKLRMEIGNFSKPETTTYQTADNSRTPTMGL